MRPGAGAYLKKAAKNSIAVLLGLVAMLLVLELGARGLAGVLGITPYMRYHPTFGWTARANVVKRHRDSQGEFDVTYELNEHGQRGSAYPRDKPNGIRRVVVLGDSNGFGWGVASQDTFSAIIDRELGCTEVVNLSLSGYGTDQSWLRFIDEGVSFKPDLVVLQVTPNDFEEIQYAFFNQKPKPYFKIQDDGALALQNVPVKAIGQKAREFYDNSLPLPFQKWLDWNSYAFNALNGIYYRYKRNQSGQAPAPGKVFTPESTRLFTAIAGQLANRLNDLHADGILVHSSGAIQAAVDLSATGLTVVDLHEQFENPAGNASNSLYYADGYHWNAAGHRAIADGLIKAMGTVDSCRDGA